MPGEIGEFHGARAVFVKEVNIPAKHHPRFKLSGCEFAPIRPIESCVGRTRSMAMRQSAPTLMRGLQRGRSKSAAETAQESIANSIINSLSVFDKARIRMAGLTRIIK